MVIYQIIMCYKHDNEIPLLMYNTNFKVSEQVS